MRSAHALAALLLLAGPALADGYPSKPIRLITPYSGGGQSDILVRTIAPLLSTGLGQQIVIESRPGAGGNIATDAVVKSPRDGYTLLFGAPLLAINASLYRNLAFDTQKSLVPISLLASGPYVLYATGKLPVSNAAELVAYAKANPGKLNYASLGVGTGPHLGGVLFALTTGVELTHVPYKGFAQSLPDLVSGQVHIAFNGIGVATAFVQSGQVKILGFASRERMRAYPDVPTVSESVPGFELLGWYGLVAPAGVPAEVIERLNAEIVKSVRAPDMWERIEKMGLIPQPQTLPEASRFFRDEIEKWGRAVKASGARIEE